MSLSNLIKQEAGTSNLSVHTCQATRRHRPAGCSPYPPKKQLDRVEKTWNASEEEESAGWGTKVGLEGGRRRKRERDDKRKNWRGSGEEGEKKKWGNGGEEGNICYDNRKI